MKNFAYVTLVSSDDYVIPAIVLNKRLKDVNSKYPLYVLVTKDLSETSIDKLMHYNVNLFFVDRLHYSEEINKNLQQSHSAYINTASKLQLYSLTQFEKIAYIDVDVYIIKNIDDIFNYEDGSCVAFRSMQYQAFSGLMIVEPCNYSYTFMKKIFESFPDVDGGFFAGFYYKTSQNASYRIPEEYLMFERSVRQKVLQKDTNIKNIKVIHYCSTVKPWIYKDVIKESLHYIYTYAIYIQAMQDLQLIPSES